MGSLSTEATVCCSTVGRRTRYNGPSAGELVRAEKVPQTLANHAEFDPRFHFFALPAFLISWMEASCWQGDIPAFLAAWEVVLMTAATGSGLQDSLGMGLRVQDRIIRLEERLHLSSILAEVERCGIEE